MIESKKDISDEGAYMDPVAMVITVGDKDFVMKPEQVEKLIADAQKSLNRFRRHKQWAAVGRALGALVKGRDLPLLIHPNEVFINGFCASYEAIGAFEDEGEKAGLEVISRAAGCKVSYTYREGWKVER